LELKYAVLCQKFEKWIPAALKKLPTPALLTHYLILAFANFNYRSTSTWFKDQHKAVATSLASRVKISMLNQIIYCRLYNLLSVHKTALLL
jgi:hypothetical protein